ncbi:MAG: hypothetical protein HFE82_08485, partial [Erysipelotrichaceae bacterium]|nr:hypothetical protein [Erysipelotrichaceae bacterium]
MWKKVLILITCLMGWLFMIYIESNGFMNNIISAQSAPAFQLPKGAKVVSGKYNNKEIVWDIGNNVNDYVLMSSKPIVNNIGKFNSSIGCTIVRHSSGGSTPYGYACPNTVLDNEINKIVLNTNEVGLITKGFYIPTYSDISTGGVLGLSLTDRAFKNGISYYLNERGNYSSSISAGWPSHLTTLAQGPQNDTNTIMLVTSTGTNIPLSEKINAIYEWYDGSVGASNLRPFGAIDHKKVMFAANAAYTDGNWHNYVIDTSNLNENNELNANKIRIQSSLLATLQDIKYKNVSTQEVIKDSTIDVTVNANTGTNTKMSVILYNDAGTDILYYKLGNTTLNGTNDYSIDLTGVAVGKYKLAVINEEFDHSSQLPVESSMISDLLPLEIVEPHKITYTKQPQSGATSGNDYEYSKNVNAGQVVGKITVNPQGVMPLTYSVDSNGDSTYQNFEIDGLSSGSSSSTSLNVKIKSGAPDLVNGGLKAGTYKFCVSAIDANGDPITATSDSKVCTSFTVEKTNPSIAFNDPAQTKKSITDAATAWNETAIATPSTGTKITYSITGGDVSLISINPDTGAITYTGSNAFGKVKIRA